MVSLRERQGAEMRVLSERILRIPFDQGTIETPLVKRQALGTKVAQLHAKMEDAKVALAGLQPSARVLEPATAPGLRQPHRDRLGALVGTLIGLLVSLASAQFASQRRLLFKCGESGFVAQLPHANLPVLSRMIRACMDDNFGAGHPLRPNLNGPAFVALERLRKQLNSLAGRKQNTSLLGITSLVAELNEFGAEEEPTLRHQISDPREGSSSHMSSLVTATISALGISHALANKKVLMVDANVFGNSMSAHLDLVDNPGLADCLTGKDHWQANVVTNNPWDVDVLPLGQVTGTGDEMLAHADLEPMLHEMRKHYDVVLVELPGVDEAPSLPELTCKLGSILVVENARTPLDAVECARLLGPLRRSGTRLIGTFVALRGVLVAAVRAA
ncbi:MAG: CpsD/CapB family tyrosine-protein kinase [bacterium]|nr:CpsD/CapB family tyrosine-protein kinase [bacterium]